VFRDPRGFIRLPLLHRTGTSYHLPNGAAVYFDTGVIEVATPAMELTRGCVTRAARSLWEAIVLIRAELDRWQRETGRAARLAGFSTHYNMSLSAGERTAIGPADLERLACALTYVLPVPVMLLATNRRSTGVGIRPRPNRLEVTADFSPDPGSMMAAGAFIVGIVRALMRRGDLSRDAVSRSVPVIEGFMPIRHTSRRGWLARFDCYPDNPFLCEVDRDPWTTSAGRLSLREIGQRIFQLFRHSIGRVADPVSLRRIAAMLAPRGPTLLALDDRPAAYDDAGRDITMPGLAPGPLARSSYERVLINAIARRPLRLLGADATPVAVRGWSRVLFRRPDGRELVVPIDQLVDRLDEWES
jgi:hypothetical protein